MHASFQNQWENTSIPKQIIAPSSCVLNRIRKTMRWQSQIACSYMAKRMSGEKWTILRSDIWSDAIVFTKRKRTGLPRAMAQKGPSGASGLRTHTLSCPIPTDPLTIHISCMAKGYISKTNVWFPQSSLIRDWNVFKKLRQGKFIVLRWGCDGVRPPNDDDEQHEQSLCSAELHRSSGKSWSHFYERTHLTNCEHLQIHLYSFDDFMAQNSLLLRVHEMTWYYNFDFWIWILERKSKLKPF